LSQQMNAQPHNHRAHRYGTSQNLGVEGIEAVS
jgi:hypothetical protein